LSQESSPKTGKSKLPIAPGTMQWSGSAIFSTNFDFGEVFQAQEGCYSDKKPVAHLSRIQNRKMSDL
jgi:hypothetical protein